MASEGEPRALALKIVPRPRCVRCKWGNVRMSYAMVCRECGDDGVEYISGTCGDCELQTRLIVCGDCAEKAPTCECGPVCVACLAAELTIEDSDEDPGMAPSKK